MKKRFLLLICSFLLSSGVVFNFSDEYIKKDYYFYETYYQNDSSTGAQYLGENFMFDYFFNNKENIIYNSQILGCCGYVSIAQLLMYYDTILDDNIIDDSYVNKSNIDVNDSWTEAPGVLSNEELVFEYEALNQGKMRNVQFINEIRNISNSFFGELIDCAITKEVFPNDVIAILNLIGPNEDHYADFGTSNEDRKNIIEQYFSNINYSGLSVNLLSDETYNHQAQIKGEIVDLIELGYPVNLSIYDRVSGYGHSVIAYFVDENENIYCHGGYNDDYFVPINVFFEDTVIRNALYLSIVNNSHVCSGNYLLNGVEQCAHNFSCHKHIYKYVSNGKVNHTANCYCGYSVIENHIMTSTGTGSKCIHCNYFSKDNKIPIIQNNLKKEEDEE